MLAATPRIESTNTRGSSESGGSALRPCSARASAESVPAPNRMRAAPTASGVYVPPAKASLPKTGKSAKNSWTAQSAACAANSPRPARTAAASASIPPR
jgi:hypothetical protein